MVASTIYADTSALFDAVIARDTERIIDETLHLLGSEDVPPARIAGRFGLAALWGGCSPHLLAAFATAGRVAEWMRAVPIGSEPRADLQRRLWPALPLTQGLVAVASAIAKGMTEPHPALPEPLMPDKVQNPDGALGGLRAAYAAHDLQQLERILLGYSGSGADYRATITAIFATQEFHYPHSGHPAIFARAGMRILDMAGWGGTMDALISWYAPLMVDQSPDTPAAEAARAFAADPANDLGWMRTRLAFAHEAAAGPSYQQALLTGDALSACAATLAALRAGATPQGVTAGMELAVARVLNTLPAGDTDALIRGGHALLYVHAIRELMHQTQDPVAWPILYTASAVTNSLAAQTAAAVAPPVAPAAAPAAASVPAPLGGGLIAPAMLRSLEQQVATGDTPGAVASMRRYLQMGNPPTALAGILGSVAARTDITSEATVHVLPLVTAATEAHLMLPTALSPSGESPLLTLAIRLASELRGPTVVAEQVRDAIARATA